MKRALQSDAPAGSQQQAGREFLFAFSTEEDDPAAANGGLPAAAPVDCETDLSDRGPFPAPNGAAASLTACRVVKAFIDPITQFALPEGAVVDVDWEASTPYRLRVTRWEEAGDIRVGSNSSSGEQQHQLDAAEWGTVPPLHVVPLFTSRDISDATYYTSQLRSQAAAASAASLPPHTRTFASLTATVHDSVWSPTSQLTPSPHFSVSPLSLEPGLDALVWPLTSREFLRRFYRRSALCVHSTGSRFASGLKPDLNGYDVKRLVKESSRVIGAFIVLG